VFINEIKAFLGQVMAKEIRTFGPRASWEVGLTYAAGGYGWIRFAGKAAR